MKNTTYPQSGVDIILEYKKEFCISTRELARRINVDSDLLSLTLHENTRLSPVMAYKLCYFFHLDVETILTMQAYYEAWMITTKGSKHILTDVETVNDFIRDRRIEDIQKKIAKELVMAGY